MGLLSILILSIAVTLSAHRQAAAPAPQQDAPPTAPIAVPDSFQAARMAPADVKVFIHIERAGRLRRDLAQRPIAHALTSFAGASAAVKSWSDLARSLNLDEAALFDTCFGREFTFVCRDEGEWALISDLGAEQTRDILRALAVRVREPRFGLAVSELPEQAVLLASDGGQVVIGPAGGSRLFDDILERWNAGGDRPADDAPLATLAGDAEFLARLGDLKCDASRGNVAAFIRHAQPMGGCSMFTASVRGDDVAIKHASRFDNPPFNSPITRLACDFSALNVLAENALLTIMQPRDVGDGPVESYLSAGLGVGLISAEMRDNLADRRMLVVGEADARQMPQPRDILTTTFVACLELKNVEVAPQQLDRQMAALTRRLNDLGQGAFLIQMPDAAALRSNAARHADLGAAGDWITGGFPVMKTVSLNWAIAEGPPNADGSAGPSWFVVGSHPLALTETMTALRKPCVPDEKLIGQYDSCGAANGVRIGRQVRSWSDEAPEFADAQHVEEVRTTLRTFADLATGLKDCRWQMARPTANTMRLEMQLKLAPAETVK